MSNHARKSDYENATVVDTSEFTKKTYLGSIKLEIDKLETYLSKVSVIAKNEVAYKKAVYDELVKKVSAIDTSELVKKQIIIIR